MDPERLIQDGASDFESVLLRAGQRDAVPAESRRRIITGLGIGGGILTASTIASGVKATTTKGFWSTLGIGSTVGAVGALAVWTGVTVFGEDAEQHAPSAAVSSQLRAVPAPAPLPRAPVEEAPAVVVEPSMAERAAAPSAPEPELRTAPQRRSVGAPADSLAAELAALEQARTALRRNEYGLALRLLDDYQVKFPKRRLNAEATVLRIETFSARGDKEAAARLGRAFLANHPNAPYARRVRSLIGENAPSKTEP